jgi:hypothetical protein
MNLAKRLQIPKSENLKIIIHKARTGWNFTLSRKVALEVVALIACFLVADPPTKVPPLPLAPLHYLLYHSLCAEGYHN